MGQGLSVPGVTINNDTVAIVPNSLKYDGGEGEINVRAASGGGDNVESVHTVNAETKISMVSFEVYLVSGMDGKINNWKRNIGANSIEFSQQTPSGNFNLSFANMSLSAAVERTASQDGVIPLEFKGDPMAAQPAV